MHSGNHAGGHAHGAHGAHGVSAYGSNSQGGDVSRGGTGRGGTMGVGAEALILPTEGVFTSKPLDVELFRATHTSLLAALYMDLGATPRAMALSAPQVTPLPLTQSYIPLPTLTSNPS